MKDSIFRLRPVNETTLDELKQHYLWFSKPRCFNDVEDANVGLFIEKNKIVNDALSQIFEEGQIKELSNNMQHIGICCFTTDMPSYKNKGYFPNGKNSIIVEYDRFALKDYFLNPPYAIADCFKSESTLKSGF